MSDEKQIENEVQLGAESAFFHAKSLKISGESKAVIKWILGVLSALTVGALGTFALFGFNHATLPAEDVKINAVVAKQITTDEKVSTIFIKTIVIEGNLNEVKTDLKDFIKEMRDRDNANRIDMQTRDNNNRRDIKEVKQNTSK